MDQVKRELARETLHRGAKFDLERVVVETEGGTQLERDVVRHGGAVVILGILDDGHVLLIETHRIPVGETLTELPAGTLEEGEAPEECAARELIEETGYRATQIEALGTFFTTPGMTNELMHAFVATGLTFVGQALEEGELIEVRPTPAGEALSMARDGRLRDGKSMLALFLAERGGWIGRT